MKNKKVYILLQQVFKIDTEGGADIIGVYTTREKAEEKQKTLIKDDVENWDFIEDTQNNENCKILFYGFEENWDNYIEYSIIETEVL